MSVCLSNIVKSMFVCNTSDHRVSVTVNAGVQQYIKIRVRREITCNKIKIKKTSTKGTMDRKGVRATDVIADHCTHAELTSGHALASCYSCCVHSRGLC